MVRWDSSDDWDRSAGSNVSHPSGTVTGGYGSDAPVVNPPWTLEADGVSAVIHDLTHPQAVYDPAADATYVAWQNLDIRRATYDHGTGTWTHHGELSNPQAGDPDDHGAPALAIAGDGTIIMFYGEHAQDNPKLRVWASSSPNDFSSGSVSQPFSFDLTYPQPRTRSTGEVFLFYRYFIGLNEQDMGFATSNDGVNWSGNTQLITGNATTQDYRIYPQDVVYDGDGDVFWIAFNLQDDDASTRNEGYVIGYDPSADQFLDVAGNTYSRPLTQSTFDGQNPIKAYTGNSNYEIINKLAVVDGEYHLTVLDEAVDDIKHVYYAGSGWTSPTTIASTPNSYGFLDARAADDIDHYHPESDYSVAVYNWDGSTWSRTRQLGGNFHAGDQRMLLNPVLNGTDELKYLHGMWNPQEFFTPLWMTAADRDGRFVGETYRTDSDILNAYWPFDSDLQDKSGNGNDASNSNANTNPSTFYLGGGAVEFTGSGDTLTIPGGSPYGGSDFPFSYSAWVYPTTSQTGQYYLFTDDDDLNTYSGISVYYDGDNGDTIQIRLGDGLSGGGSNNHRFVATDSLTINAWNHVAVTLRSLTDAAIWINGVNQAFSVTDTGDISSIGRNGSGGFIGRGNIYNSGSVQAVVDEARVYSIGLNDRRVELLRTARSSPTHITQPKVVQ
jgi:hypothetical protein